MKKLLDIEEVLGNLSNIKDKGEEIIYLHQIHQDYEQLNEFEKKQISENLKQKTAFLRQQVNDILAKS